MSRFVRTPTGLVPRGQHRQPAPPTRPHPPAKPTTTAKAAPPSKPAPPPAPTSRWRTRRPSSPPSVLVLADVANWAWARKARALAQHLAGRIDVTVAFQTDPKARALIEAQAHDLYHTFEVCQVGTIPAGWPMTTGITAHVAKNYDEQRGYGTVRAWADRAKGFHANSRMLQREMEAYLGRPVYYVPNGVDERFFCRTRPRESSRLVVGYVARPNVRKGPDLVRDACKRAGVELREVVRTWKQALSAEQIREFYQGIHVLAVSSDMDGTPNPALEAAACECAVVSNPIGNMPEFIRDGVNGFLTERTVDGLAAALAELAGNVPRAIEMGREARATILDEWTWATRAHAYAAMWEACL
jgi:glycosyltransferase involved in cell wall biosynthesis